LPGGWRHHLQVVRPATVLRWHRKGWRLYWTWKSRTKLGRRPHSQRRDQSANRPHLAGESVVGHGAYPGRAAEARSRRQQPFNPALPLATAPHQRSSVLAELPSQRVARHLGAGSVRGPDRELSHPLCLLAPPPREARADSLQRYGRSDRGLDRAPTTGGHSSRSAAQVPDPRPGCRLLLRL
jgi:hypothetical protein